MTNLHSLTLLTVCGLPASGKSTLCNQLKDWAELKDLDLVTVSFDSFLGRFFDLTADESTWKTHRAEVFKSVECLVYQLLGKAEATYDINCGLIQRSDNSYELTRCNSTTKPQENCKLSRHRVLVILDDNFFYSSMRYEYFKLAKLSRIGFGQILIDCAPETASRRNALRPLDERVSNATISKMSALFERPNVDERWQRNSQTVYSDSLNEVVSVAARQSVVTVIRHAFENPVLIADEEELKSRQSEEERQRNLQNVLHQAEILCRRLVSLCMKPNTAEQARPFWGLVAAAATQLPAEPRDRLALISSVKQDVIRVLKTSSEELFDLAALEQFICSTFATILSSKVIAK